MNNGLYGNRKAAAEVFGKYAVSFSESWKGGIRNLYDKLGLSREMSAGEFLDNHTALLIFKPFMSAERYAVAQKKILDIQLSGIAQHLGITGGPFFKPSHGYCLECMTQELRDMGYAFPHRVHQLVGVALCPFHDTKLGNLNHQDHAFHCINGLVLPVAHSTPPIPSLNISTDPGYLEVSRKFGAWVYFILNNGLPHRS